jgi:hypothetical protein
VKLSPFPIEEDYLDKMGSFFALLEHETKGFQDIEAIYKIIDREEIEKVVADLELADLPNQGEYFKSNKSVIS